MMTFHESYGEVSKAQLAAYRKFNVSPSDHNDLVEAFGEDRHDEITNYVKVNAAASGGMFRVFDLWMGR
jgi:hypothetical protein